MADELLKIAFKHFNSNCTNYFDFVIGPEDFVHREPRLIDLDRKQFSDFKTFLSLNFCAVSLQRNYPQKTYTLTITQFKPKFNLETVEGFINSSRFHGVKYENYFHSLRTVQCGRKVKEIATEADAEKVAAHFKTIADKFIERCTTILNNLKLLKIEEIVAKKLELENEIETAREKLSDYNEKTEKYLTKMLSALED